VLPTCSEANRRFSIACIALSRMVSEVVSQRTSGAPDAAVRCAEVYVMSTQLRVHERRQFRERGIVALARCA
jgi:hypothetical protein